MVDMCNISPISLNGSLNTNLAIPVLTSTAPITTIQRHYHSSELYEKTQHCIVTVTDYWYPPEWAYIHTYTSVIFYIHSNCGTIPLQWCNRGGTLYCRKYLLLKATLVIRI